MVMTGMEHKIHRMLSHTRRTALSFISKKGLLMENNSLISISFLP